MEPLTGKGLRAAAGGGNQKASCGESCMEACAGEGLDRDKGNGVGGMNGAAGKGDESKECSAAERDAACGSGALERDAVKKRGLRLRISHMPLRSYFLLVVFAVFGGVVLLSGLAIWGCAAFRQYLLPDPDAAYLTVEEIRADGTVTETTTWLDFGKATKLPQLVGEESGYMEEGEDGASDPEPELAASDKAPEMELTEDGAIKSGQSEPTETDIDWQGGQSESAETDIGWRGGQYTTRKVDHGEVVDATYSIQKIEKSFDTLSPRRKLAYRFCGAAMVAVPALLSIGGILFAGFFFYRKRLAEPLAILSRATGQIAARNLDFSIEYPCGDEMGALCRSFERMREELARNNKSMWRLLDQRRLMQASIAHDLRNPIAIIQGYAEYLEMHLPAGDLSPEKTARIASNLKSAALRLEQYTESVRALNRLEDMEPDRKEIEVCQLMEEIRDDLEVMADRYGVAMHMEEKLSMEKNRSAEEKRAMEKLHSTEEDCAIEVMHFMEGKRYMEKPSAEDRLMVDRTMLFRILENVFENAARFAKSQVHVEFERKEKGLTVTVADDGPGFPEELLKKRGKALLPTRQEDGHLGMGLAISRVLCEKHGGSLRLGNRMPQGAVVKIFLTV